MADRMHPLLGAGRRRRPAAAAAGLSRPAFLPSNSCRSSLPSSMDSFSAQPAGLASPAKPPLPPPTATSSQRSAGTVSGGEVAQAPCALAPAGSLKRTLSSCAEAGADSDTSSQGCSKSQRGSVAATPARRPAAQLAPCAWAAGDSGDEAADSAAGSGDDGLEFLLRACEMLDPHLEVARWAPFCSPFFFILGIGKLARWARLRLWFRGLAVDGAGLVGCAAGAQLHAGVWQVRSSWGAPANGLACCLLAISNCCAGLPKLSPRPAPRFPAGTPAPPRCPTTCTSMAAHPQPMAPPRSHASPATALPAWKRLPLAPPAAPSAAACWPAARSRMRTGRRAATMTLQMPMPTTCRVAA